MATNTANYGLVKAAPTENYDVAVVNANLDTTDTQLKVRQTNIDNANAATAALTNRVADLENANTKSVALCSPLAALALPAATATPVQFAAATRNEATFTKTSTTVWTCTKAGVYIITMHVQVTAFQDPTGTRAHAYILSGNPALLTTSRTTYTGENLAVITIVREMAIGDIISGGVYVTQATSITTGVNSFLNAVRIGT